MSEKPSNCRNRLRDEGKPYPRSGCGHCSNGGLLGCPFDRHTPPASHDGGEAELEALLETYWCCAFTEGAEGRMRDNVAGEAQQTLSAIRAQFATLTAEVDSLRSQVSRLTGELAEAREIIDGFRAQSLRYKASMDECERLRKALREIANLMTTNPDHMARIAEAALTAGEKA